MLWIIQIQMKALRNATNLQSSLKSLESWSLDQCLITQNWQKFMNALHSNAAMCLPLNPFATCSFYFLYNLLEEKSNTENFSFCDV